ncbi:AtpZ/AtpI family protein [Roseivivax isoporae]|uniref:ATP synthase protein I n=1 Tax=Roseivivax isoporae LMG 25204 TaxID=1449351 RepID=X7FAQ0_9RHOB|nr:AtpZ/AtpI family protein [Roseivivax isoporae]ETX29977.1 ATP synthase F0 subunit I [Roseivivax isoporae LMG 25204]
MTDPDQKTRLAALEARIAAAKAAKAPPKAHQEEHYSQAQLAWRMVIELVAGLGIGFGIGFGLDTLFGTLPFLMVIFTLLGFVAGVQTMVRSANELQRKRIAEADAAAAGNNADTSDGAMSGQDEDEGHGDGNARS